MRSLGNEAANSIWESTLHLSRSYRKPDSNSSQEEKERFIFAKYHQKEFLQPFSSSSVSACLAEGLFRSEPFSHKEFTFCGPASLINECLHIIKSLFRSDMKAVAVVLAHAALDDINAPVNAVSGSTPLHLASSVGNLAMVQLLIWV